MGKLNLTINLDNLSQEDRDKFFQLVEKSKEIKPSNPFERVKHKENYYIITSDGRLARNQESNDGSDERLVDKCNYYNDKEFAKRQALRELLNRKLIKFSYENGGADIDFSNTCKKYRVIFDKYDNKYEVSYSVYAGVLTPLFISEEVAQRAIEEVIKPFLKEHPDFKWWG